MTFVELQAKKKSPQGVSLMSPNCQRALNDDSNDREQLVVEWKESVPQI